MFLFAGGHNSHPKEGGLAKELLEEFEVPASLYPAPSPPEIAPALLLTGSSARMTWYRGGGVPFELALMCFSTAPLLSSV